MITFTLFVILSSPAWAQDQAEVREYEPFRIRSHTLYGDTYKFHLAEAWEVDFPTKVLVKTWESPDGDTIKSKILESARGVKFIISYIDPRDPQSFPYSDVQINVPLSEVSDHVLEKLRSSVSGERMRSLRNHIKVSIEEHTAPVKEIDFACSHLCPDDGPLPGSCEDRIVWKTVMKVFKKVSLVKVQPAE